MSDDNNTKPTDDKPAMLTVQMVNETIAAVRAMARITGPMSLETAYAEATLVSGVLWAIAVDRAEDPKTMARMLCNGVPSLCAALDTIEFLAAKDKDAAALPEFAFAQGKGEA